MDYQRLAIPDVVLMTPKIFADERGFFLETFRQSEFEQHCGHHVFVQDNHSQSAKGVLRGLHYQLNQPQGKLMRASRGKIFDVAVDMRQRSPTFGQWVGAVLDDESKQLLWIPPGFAHGFYVVSEAAEIQYKCTDYYAPGDEFSIHWDDPRLGIRWPLDGGTPQLSKKDEAGFSFDDAPVFTK